MDLPRTGIIKWVDLTVDNADEVRDFYEAVVGWTHQTLENEGRDDYIMLHRDSGNVATGICWQKGSLKGLPQQWLPYVTVDDLDDSMRSADAAGGKVIFGPRDSETMGRWCVVEDPAGAVMALTELTPGEDN